jgi:hypothetical protein
MIADSQNTCSINNSIKKFITPHLRQFRALFFLFCISATTTPVVAQMSNVDSLIRWVDSYPYNDTAKIHAMHTISYLLFE